MLSWISKRSFHSSAPLLLRLDSPLIWKVDWDQVGSGHYCIADPLDPGSLLYFSDREYRNMVKVSISNDTPLVVIARPFESKPDDRDIPSSNPKPKPTPPVILTSAFHAGVRKYSSRFRRKFWWVIKQGGAVEPRQSNLARLIAHWGHTLWVWNEFPAMSSGLTEGFSSATQALRTILRTQGPLGLVLYLKASYIAIQKHLAGTPLTSTWELGTRVRLSRNGLPVWIPVEARRAIAVGHAPTIRLWLSTLYVYKAMKTENLPRKVWAQLGTIGKESLPYTPERYSLLGDFRQWLHDVWVPSLGGPFTLPTAEHLAAGPLDLWHAGASGSPGILQMGKEALLVLNDQTLRHELLSTLIYHGDRSDGLDTLLEQSKLPTSAESLQSHWSAFTKGNNPTPNSPPCLGRLHALYEAGGKVRIIAMFDYWSQRALKPLHDHLFSILKRIGEDGLYDQSRLWNQILERYKGSPDMTWSSLDISSATDMIPIDLYRVILEELYTHPGLSTSGHTDREVAEDYVRGVITLMTKRDFLGPIDICNNRPGSYEPAEYSDLLSTLRDKPCTVNPYDFRHSCRTVRYGRGQPMGAFASFGLLSLWHHAWIRFSAYRVNCPIGLQTPSASPPGPMAVYGVVGDDSVIGEHHEDVPVAHEYLDLCASFEIPIKLIKSFKAAKAVSFLSRFAARGCELSPASFKEELQVSSYTSRIQLCGKLLARGWLEGSPNLVARYSRLFVNHYEYISGVAVSNHFGRFHPVVHRALFALLSPSGPYFDPSVEGVQRLLNAWIALSEGKSQVLAKFLSGNMEYYLPGNLHSGLTLLLTFSRIIIREFVKASKSAREDMIVMYNDAIEEYSDNFLKEYNSQDPLLQSIFPKRYFARFMPTDEGFQRLSWRRRLTFFEEEVTKSARDHDSMTALYGKGIELIAGSLVDLSNQEGPWPIISDPNWVKVKAKAKFLEGQLTFWDTVIDLFFEAIDELRMSHLSDTHDQYVSVSSHVAQGLDPPESQTPLTDGMSNISKSDPLLDGVTPAVEPTVPVDIDEEGALWASL